MTALHTITRVWISCLLLLSNVVQAAPLQWEGKYSHFSDQEPLADVLKAIAAEEGTPIVISPRIKDVVSLHVIDKNPADIFKDLSKNYGLIWYYDKESLYVYKKEEAQTASVSMKKMTPNEFTTALKRVELLDDQYQWQVSEVDNVVYFTGPERFVSAVLDMAKVMDTQQLGRQQIYRWRDKSGTINFSSDSPVSSAENAKLDVKTEEKYPGFNVVDVVKNK